MSDNANAICLHYLNNSCTRGLQCSFLHIKIQNTPCADASSADGIPQAKASQSMLLDAGPVSNSPTSRVSFDDPPALITIDKSARYSRLANRLEAALGKGPRGDDQRVK